MQLSYLLSFFKMLHIRAKHVRRKTLSVILAACLAVPFLYYLADTTCLHTQIKGYITGSVLKNIEREYLIPDYIDGQLIKNKTAVKLIMDFNKKPVLVQKKKDENAAKESPAAKDSILVKKDPVWDKEKPRVNLARESQVLKKQISTKKDRKRKEWPEGNLAKEHQFPKDPIFTKNDPREKERQRAGLANEPQIPKDHIFPKTNPRRKERPGFDIVKEPKVSKERLSTSNSPWSKEWPRVNLKNCSTIVYMNRGVNSPTNIKNGVYPLTGIVSFPGSGNTWSRHLIQQATGLWTGSVYHDRSLFMGGLMGELEPCDNNSTVAIKAHFATLDIHRCTFERAVLVVRDPFRAVLAEFNWRATSKHTGIADKRLYKTEEWSKHVFQRSKRWYTSMADWIKRFINPEAGIKGAESAFTAPPDASTKLLLVSYERLKRDTVHEMERIVKFLGLPVFRRSCIEDDVNGNFHRDSKGSESISCLFKEGGMKDVIMEHMKSLLNVTQTYRLGNIVREFEGLEGNEISDKC